MKSTVVVGLGNPILRDDAVGLHVARSLEAQLGDVDGVEVKEIYAGGIRLIDAIVGYEVAVIVDAMCSGVLEPGTVRKLDLSDLGAARNLTSTHDTNLPTALELGRMLGMQMPRKVTVFGIEAREVESFGEELSEAVQCSIPEAVRRIAREVGP